MNGKTKTRPASPWGDGAGSEDGAHAPPCRLARCRGARVAGRRARGRGGAGRTGNRTHARATAGPTRQGQPSRTPHAVSPGRPEIGKKDGNEIAETRDGRQNSRRAQSRVKSRVGVPTEPRHAPPDRPHRPPTTDHAGARRPTTATSDSEPETADAVNPTEEGGRGRESGRSGRRSTEHGGRKQL
jgi:hypothetical protein